MNRFRNKQLFQQSFTGINETQMSLITMSKFHQQLEEKPQRFCPFWSIRVHPLMKTLTEPGLCAHTPERSRSSACPSQYFAPSSPRLRFPIKNNLLLNLHSSLNLPSCQSHMNQYVKENLCTFNAWLKFSTMLIH